MRASERICARLVAMPEVRGARHVVLYAARLHEADPAALASSDLGRRCRWYYPRVEGSALTFRQASADALVPGRYGILEPPADAPPLASGSDDVAILVPGVGFDRDGGRLGTGRGYYDRTLPAHPRARLIGVTFQACIVDRVPMDPWDVTMQAVVTEDECIQVGTGVDECRGDPTWK